MRKLLFSFAVFLINIQMSEGQYCDSIFIDTTLCGNNQVIIKIPLSSLGKSRISKQFYEEGHFKTFNFRCDSVHISLHYGAMVTRPFCKSKNVFFEVKNMDNNHTVFYGKENNLYFREDWYKSHYITIMYDFVSANNKFLFDTILDSIEIVNILNQK